MKNLCMRLWNEEKGQDLLEYALLIALIVLVAGTSMLPLGNTMAKIFNSANNCLKPTTSTCS